MSYTKEDLELLEDTIICAQCIKYEACNPREKILCVAYEPIPECIDLVRELLEEN